MKLKNTERNRFFEYIDCPLCDCKVHKNHFSIEYGKLKQKPSLDYSNIGIKADSMLQVKKCVSCGFIFVNPRVKPMYENLIYNQSKENLYKNKPYCIDINKSIIYARCKRLSYLKTLIKLLENVDLSKDNVTLFDFGCGFGHAMILANSMGLKTYGIEIDNKRLEFCKQQGLNVSTPQEFTSIFPTVKADIIIIQSCHEHMLDLNGSLKIIDKLKKENTILYVNAIHSRLIKIEKRAGVFSKAHFIEHINYFTYNTIDKFNESFSKAFYS